MQPGTRGLFVRFLLIGLSGFGGVVPQIHHALVVRHRWLSAEDFAEYLGLCQFLPGPNALNLSVVIGRRFAGLRGALAAAAGLVLMPFVIVCGLAFLYHALGGFAPARGVMAGVASAAAGMIVAMGLRMGRPLWPKPAAMGLAALVVVLLVVLHLPLLWILALMLPLALLLAWRGWL